MRIPSGPHLVQELQETANAGLKMREGSSALDDEWNPEDSAKSGGRLQVGLPSYHLPLRCQETNWKIKAITLPMRFENSPLDRNHK